MSKFRCRICKQPVHAGSEYFPFCSRRCKLIDLGSWLDEKYRITRPLQNEDLAPGEPLPDRENENSMPS